METAGDCLLCPKPDSTPPGTASTHAARGHSGLFPLCILIAFALLLTGCGYIGNPLPPSLDIPSRITDLRVVEYGNNLMAQFTLPAVTTQGLGLKSIEAMTLYVGVAPVPFSNAKWLASAKSYAVPATAPGAFTHPVPAQEWIGKDIYVSVRSTGPKGKTSDWSNYVQFHVDPPLALPGSVQLKNVAKGVEMSWTGSGPHYRVFRSVGDQKLEKVTDTDQPDFVDDTTHYLTAYRYSVQSFSGELVQSELTDPQSITPTDVFPPAVPPGLTAIPSTGSIELAWERNVESDFRGYNLYRSQDNGPFEKLGAFIDTPAYSDRQIESGKVYHYAVSAVDQIGNESARSAIVDVTAQ